MEIYLDGDFMRLTLAEVKQRVSKIVPENIDYEVDLEAGSIAIITPQPELFSSPGQSLTVKIAKNIKRRVIVRPHSSILADEAEVRQKVNEIIPPEAEVRNIWLDPALSEVILECDDPAAAVGPKGIHIKNLRDEMKVAQLAAYVAEKSAYHHGEVSLADTIVKLANDYTGSNNINLLEPNYI